MTIRCQNSMAVKTWYYIPYILNTKKVWTIHSQRCIHTKNTSSLQVKCIANANRGYSTSVYIFIQCFDFTLYEIMEIAISNVWRTWKDQCNMPNVTTAHLTHLTFQIETFKLSKQSKRTNVKFIKHSEKNQQKSFIIQWTLENVETRNQRQQEF